MPRPSPNGCHATPTRGPKLFRSSGNTLVAPVLPNAASSAPFGCCGSGRNSYSYRSPAFTVSPALGRQLSCTNPAHSCVLNVTADCPKLCEYERKQKSCTFEKIDGHPPFGYAFTLKV